MKVSAIQSYDYTNKCSNNPQPIPAPTPYAAKPDFGAKVKILPSLHGSWKKLLTFVAAMGMTLGVMAKQNNSVEQLAPVKNPIELTATDGGWKLTFSVKDKKKQMKIRGDANYQFTLSDGSMYTLTHNELQGLHIYKLTSNGREEVYEIPASIRDYATLVKIGRIAGEQDVFSPEDVEQASEGIPEGQVYQIKRLPTGQSNTSAIRVLYPDGTSIKIETLNSPTASPYAHNK